MPVYQLKKISSQLDIGLWKITETEEELIQLMINQGVSLDQKPESAHPSRISQWLTTRLLLNQLVEGETISYDEYGKPHLKNGFFISISHSGHYVAIAIHKNNDCGIDIEKVTPKIERIKHKFLNQMDLENVTTQEDLTIYWGAKEALYKFYGKKEILFIENLFIKDFTKRDSRFKGEIAVKENRIELYMAYEKIDNYTLVYTL